MNTPFLKGKIYKRSQIHDQYGGSRRGGISPSAKYPYIFIFSSKAGHQHGYRDEWINKNIFSYTGEGQLNDMRFIRGNLALRDHFKTGKRVFLFIGDIKSFVEFEAELKFEDFGFFEGFDTNKNLRTAIKFFFKRVDAIKLDRSIITTIDKDLGQPNYKIPNETERKGLVTSRIGQGAYRKSVLYRWDFKCAVTDHNNSQILIASHIHPWKDSSNDERLDVDNGILLSPTYDALFDKHLISFENNGKIILSDKLQDYNIDAITVTGREKIKDMHSGNHYYLEKHRTLLR